MIADYDRSEPIYLPIILSIIVTIIVIIMITFGIIFYFKATISETARENEQNYGLSIELTQQRAYEDRYLNESNDQKINIDEAITIIHTINN